MSSIHNRINDILKQGLPQYPADDSQSEVAVIDSLFSMLQEAEQELLTVKARVDRLKWELAKVSD